MMSQRLFIVIQSVNNTGVRIWMTSAMASIQMVYSESTALLGAFRFVYHVTGE
jgi:hypothetical protein